MARPPQTRPTKAEIASYYRTLKSAAKGGCVLSCAELIKIDIMTRQLDQADPLQMAAAKGDKTAQGYVDTIETLTEALEIAQAIIAGDK